MTSRVVSNGILVVATIAVISVCRWASAFIIPLAVGIFLTGSLTPLVDRLEKTRVPRSLGAALVLAMLVGGICSAAYALRDDALGLVNSMPKAARQMQVAINHASHDPRGSLHNARSALMHVTPGNPAPNIAGSSAASAPVDTLDWQTLLCHGSLGAASALACVGVVLFLVHFLLLSDDHYKRRRNKQVSSHPRIAK